MKFFILLILGVLTNVYITADTYYLSEIKLSFLNIIYTTFIIIIIEFLFKNKKKQIFTPTDLICFFLRISVLYPYIYQVSFGLVKNENIFLIIFILIGIGIIKFVSLLKLNIKFSICSVSDNIFILFLVLANSLGLFIYITSFGHILDVNWSEMYIRRLEARKVFESSIFISYFISLYTAIVIPLTSAYSVYTKKYYLFLLAILSSIFSFMAFGGKGVLFSSFLSFGFVYLLINVKDTYGLIVRALLIIFSLMIIELYISGIPILNWYLFRRLFYIPSYFSSFYYDYFSLNDFYYMSDSILSFFNKADISKSRLIGLEYLGNIKTNANVNIFATAFGDFGFIGILLVSLFAGIYCNILNYVYKDTLNPVIILISLFVGLIWSQGAFHTSMLSNGLLPALFIVMMLPKNRFIFK